MNKFYQLNDIWGHFQNLKASNFILFHFPILSICPSHVLKKPGVPPILCYKYWLLCYKINF